MSNIHEDLKNNDMDCVFLHRRSKEFTVYGFCTDSHQLYDGTANQSGMLNCGCNKKKHLEIPYGNMTFSVGNLHVAEPALFENV